MKEINATLYKVDGSKEPLTLTSKTRLETLQNLVGGYIEVIHIIDELESIKQGKIIGNDLVINEEGILLELPYNSWSRTVAKNSIWENNPFFGDIILIDGKLP
jgi:hypothetical protein